jgi:hypothetical protein
MYYFSVWPLVPTHCRYRGLLLHLVTHSAGLLWMTDRSVAETSTWQHTTLARDRHPFPPPGFEPAIPASERPQTQALDRAAIGISCILVAKLILSDSLENIILKVWKLSSGAVRAVTLWHPLSTLRERENLTGGRRWSFQVIGEIYDVEWGKHFWSCKIRLIAFCDKISSLTYPSRALHYR